MKQEQSELDRMAEVQPQSHIIGGFLEWAESQGIQLTQRIIPTEENDYQYRGPLNLSINQLLAQYFDINLFEVEKEKQALLLSIRANMKEREHDNQ